MRISSLTNAAFLAALLILASPDSFSSARADEISKTEEKTFDFKPGGRVQVVGDAGYLRVESWDKNEVFLRYTKRVWEARRRDAERRMEDLQVEITVQPDQLTIRQIPGFQRERFTFFDLFDPDRWGHTRHSARIDFELRVPRQCNLVLESDEGDITVRHIEGEVQIDSDEGNVDLENLSMGKVVVATDEGEIECRDSQLGDHRLALSSDEGTIRVTDLSGRSLSAEADEGDIVLMRINATSGKLSTDEGDVELDAARFDEGEWNITTDEGDVDLFLPTNADVEITLESRDGNIRSDFSLTRVSEENEHLDRRTGRLGNGRGKLEVQTDEGDINLRRR
ncbi:MAG: DUF4097 domain-containing protein [candidate division KSB1 bacterium]|nr:DUF4097 domain-containing protein [candidate division KSB1 bacterium]MDZ7303400.1 DUF4097 domain-containing protein [candidate division KSB1 bacterium]MDZ7312282.1 DUF4097 domain-containing protein [candidate division KSB1 bacterium]